MLTLPGQSKGKICRGQKVNGMIILLCKYTHKVLSNYGVKLQESKKSILFRCLILFGADQKDFQKLPLLKNNYMPSFVDLSKGCLSRIWWARIQPLDNSGI